MIHQVNQSYMVLLMNSMDAFNLKSLDELPELKEIESEFDEEDIFNTKYQEKGKRKPEISF